MSYMPCNSGGGNKKEMIVVKTGGIPNSNPVTIDLHDFVKDVSAVSVSDFYFSCTMVISRQAQTAGTWYVAYPFTYDPSTGLLYYRATDMSVSNTNIYVYAEPK